MKFKSLLFVAAASLLAFAGCQSKENTTPSGETTFELNKETLEFTKDAGENTVTLTSNIAWTVKDLDKIPGWLSVAPTSGDGNATITVTVTENKGANNEHNIVFYGNKAYSATLTVKQEGPQGDAEALTVAEFLEKKDTQNAYKLTGTVSNFSSQYCNFDLTDETGKIYVYSLDADSKTKYGAKIANGGKITVKGVYKWFEHKTDPSKSKAEIENAEVISYEGAEPIDPSKVEAISIAEFLSKKDTKTPYKLTGTVSSFNSQYCSFDLEQDGSKIYVYSVKAASREQFASQISNGSTVTVVGVYYWYENADPSKSKAEIMDATIVSVSGGEDPSEWESAVAKTVSEFLAAADATTYFKLTGKISNYGASNGRFDLTDATGTVYVYEVLNKDQYTMKDGGTVTLAGKYKLYEQTPEVVSAHILSYDKSTEDPDVVLAHSLTSTIKWTLGSGAYDNTSSGTSKQSALVNGTTVDNLLKLGKSSGAGSATLTIPAGVTKIGFYSAGWQAAAITVGTKTVNVPSNAGCTGNPPYTLNFTDAANYFEVDVTPGSVEVSCPTRVLLIGINPAN